MEPGPPPQSSSASVLSLVKRLAGQRWISVYELLLDITGEHRDETVPQHSQVHLADVISELLIIGDETNAAKLERVSSSLSTDTEHSDCLSVLLSVANKTREKSRNLPSFPAAEISDSPNSLLPNFRIQPFTSRYAAEPNKPPTISFTNLAIDSQSSSTVDCIADTSRCEHDSYNLWLYSNLDSARTTLESGAHGDDEHQHSSASFLDSISAPDPKKSTPNPHFIPDVQAPKNGATQEDSHQFEISRAFLHEVCHLCLAGPDVCDRPRSDTSMRPTSLFEASTTPGFEPSNERSHAFARRRTLVYEMKKWSQQVRNRSRQLHPVPSNVRALMCGLICQSVISFAPAYISKHSSIALKALVSYVTLCTDEYLGAILDATAKPCSDPAALDLIVLDIAESYSVKLREIATVLEAVEKTDGSSEEVLRSVSGRLRCFPSSEWLQGLFIHMTLKYEKVLTDWVKEGSCNLEESASVAESTKLGSSLTSRALKLTGSPPKMSSSPSTRAGDVLFSESQALFLRRAGYGRAILRELSSSHCSSRTEACSDFSPAGGDVMKNYSRGFCSQAVHSAASEDNASQNPVTRAFTGPLESYSDAQSVPDQTLNSAIPCFPFRDEMVPALHSVRDRSNLPDEKSANATETSCELGRVELAVYPTLYAEQVVDQFREEDGHVQRQIFDIFVTKLDVFAHLNFIRKFVLLSAGDFANELAEQMNAASSASESSEAFLQHRKRAALTFYGSADAGKSHVRSLLYLRRCFRTAAYLFNADTEGFISRLTVEIGSSIDGSNSRKDLWDYQVEFGYSVADPLKLVLSEDAMSMYSKIHWFFLRVTRAKMSLRNLFMVTRRRSMLNRLGRQNVMRDVHVRATIWLFCMDSEQFVNKLGGFFMDQVIGSGWEAFHDVWGSCENVWALRDAHERFLEGSIQRCLLDPRQKSVCSVISGGFDIIRNVEKEVMKLQQSSSLVAMKVGNVQDFVSSASASLRRRSLFLADILGRLSEAGTLHATS